RHTVLVMAALAICAVTAALLRDRTNTQAPAPIRPGQPPPADPGMIPLTVPEIGRLLTTLLPWPAPPGHAGRWPDWRRRHQARSPTWAGHPGGGPRPRGEISDADSYPRGHNTTRQSVPYVLRADPDPAKRQRAGPGPSV